MACEFRRQSTATKKTNDDSLNVGLLVKHVDTLADALASYEEKNELEFGDPYLLDKLHGILCLVQDLTGPIDKMTKDRAKMVSIRAKRSSKSLNREKELIELAIASLKQNRKQSSKRAVAHNIAPTVGLKPNTVEKKLAPVWATVQKSMPSK